jgi:UDP-N-acetylglucosamine 4,6-dehydratase
MRYLILGATGTLGRAMTKELLKENDTYQIRCLSRDELKQSEFLKEFDDPRIEMVLGDIRDREGIKRHFKGIDVVFHFAALKRIPEMERQPLESLKTNVLGTINAAECALEYGVEHFMFSSTDKAALPINTYGASKFLAEKILTNLNELGETNFSVYRWGNILASRGSVVFAFKDTIEAAAPAHITHEDMTRFWLKIEDAVKFVLDTYTARSNEVRVPEMKSAKVLDVLGAVAKRFGKDPEYKVVGLRPGEKIHEHILFKEGEEISSQTSERYSEEEIQNLVWSIL